MKKLPIGIQTFEKLIKEEYTYVDKTHFLSSIGQGGFYFLSRPPSTPYDWYQEQQAAGYEAYYASIVYCYFAATGIDVRPEVHSNKGRLDLVVYFEDRVYVLEFKVVEQCGEGKALEQIKAKGYAEQFAGKEVSLIGVEFSSQKRNIEAFEWEEAICG